MDFLHASSEKLCEFQGLYQMGNYHLIMRNKYYFDFYHFIYFILICMISFDQLQCHHDTVMMYCRSLCVDTDHYLHEPALWQKWSCWGQWMPLTRNHMQIEIWLADQQTVSGLRSGSGPKQHPISSRVEIPFPTMPGLSFQISKDQDVPKFLPKKMLKTNFQSLGSL